MRVLLWILFVCAVIWGLAISFAKDDPSDKK